jgi:hypothetical protein
MRTRKFLLSGLAVVAVTAITVPVAMAATQVNTYTVKGAIKGGKGATKKKPKAVSVNFDYTVGEATGLRPSPVTNYSIFFGGLQTNGTKFAGCDVKKLNAASNTKGTAVCPAKSIMGSGRIINNVGNPDNLADKSLYCYLTLTTVNGTKKNQFLLYLKGVQKNGVLPEDKTCVTAVAQAIDAKFVKKSGGTALEFGVPANLLHPSGLDNAVVNVESTIKKVTTKVKGKKVGFFESTNCKSTQKISVTFTQETDGSKKVADTTVPCTK